MWFASRLLVYAEVYRPFPRPRAQKEVRGRSRSLAPQKRPGAVSPAFGRDACKSCPSARVDIRRREALPLKLRGIGWKHLDPPQKSDDPPLLLFRIAKAQGRSCFPSGPAKQRGRTKQGAPDILGGVKATCLHQQLPLLRGEIAAQMFSHLAGAHGKAGERPGAPGEHLQQSGMQYLVQMPFGVGGSSRHRPLAT